MKSKPPLLTRLWRKLFPKEAPKAPVRLTAEQRPLPGRDRLRERGIEPLEGRIAPAVLMPNGLDLKYTDTDGDLVTIHFSKSIFIAAPGGSVDTILSSVFTFDHGTAHTGAVNGTDDVPQLLEKIDLTSIRPNASVTPATGVSFTISAVKGNNSGTPVGDGLANVGAINAQGIALGKIVIPGDLGQIDVGLSTAKTALASLTVKSLGALTNTQAGTADYESTVIGAIGTFTADTVVGAYLHVEGASASSGSGTAAVGNIGTLTIHHYLKSRDVTADAVTNDGLIDINGSIGTLTIGSGVRDAAHPDLSDGLSGGLGDTSGSIKVGAGITKAIIRGDLHGSAGTSSGTIVATGQITTLQVAGSLLGSGTSSGSITAGKFGTISIGTAADGSDGRGLVGGAGDGSGVITSNGTITAATITNIQGSGPNSGGITASGAIASITVNGFVKGGTGAHSGFIDSDTSLGKVKLLGDLVGGDGAGSGVVSGQGGITSFTGVSIIGDSTVNLGLDSGGVTAEGKIGTVLLTGSLTGGLSDHSGYLDSNFSIGNITIKGDVTGGSGLQSGSILSATTIGIVNITGHLKGGDVTVTPADGSTPAVTSGGDFSGTISAGAAGIGGITSVTIGHGLIGGGGTSSGVISSIGNIGTVSLTTPHAVGTEPDAMTGGDGDSSGVIYSFGTIKTVTVKGSITGGAGLHSGTIQEHGLLTTITVFGDLHGGAGDDSGGILAQDIGSLSGTHAAGGLGTVNVHGSVIGGDGLRSGVISSDGAIKALTLGGLFQGSSATSGRIVSGAGFDAAGNITTLNLGQVGSATLTGGSVLAYGAVGTLTTKAVTTGAIHVQDSIAALKITGALTNSTITAGGQAVFNGKTDLAIGSITIAGTVSGSSIEAGYGILNDAENGHAQIGAVKVTGDWLSSNLVAGVQDAGAAGFGDSGDQLIPGNTSTVKARIASVVITGTVDGAGAGHQYGFVAQEIGAFQSHLGKAKLTAATGEATVYNGASGGTVSVREILPVV